MMTTKREFVRILRSSYSFFPFILSAVRAKQFWSWVFLDNSHETIQLNSYHHHNQSFILTFFFVLTITVFFGDKSSVGGFDTFGLFWNLTTRL